MTKKKLYTFLLEKQKKSLLKLQPEKHLSLVTQNMCQRSKYQPNTIPNSVIYWGLTKAVIHLHLREQFSQQQRSV